MTKATIPYPGQPLHTANLCTIPLLEAQGWEGSDASLAISLFEYDLAWRRLDPPEEGCDVAFIYRIAGDKPDEKRFDRCSMDSAVSLAKEFSWISEKDWQDLYDSYGTSREDWEEDSSYEQKIHDLVNRWGYANIFGSASWEGFAIRDPEHDYGSKPAPGETPADYQSRLLYGDDRNEPGLCSEFVRDEDGLWFMTGPYLKNGVGEALCQWHQDMDAIYAAGSGIIANHQVPLAVAREAVDLLRQCATKPLGPYASADAIQEAACNRAHAAALVELLEYAISAEPSSEVQVYAG